MSFQSCPTAIVDAPAECVWTLLTQPSGSGEVFDLCGVRVDPPGPANIGQKIYAKAVHGFFL